MTYREKVIKEHPEDIGEQWTGGVKYCPAFYGYEEELWCFNRANNSRSKCEECWNREIEEKENKTMKYKVGDVVHAKGKVVELGMDTLLEDVKVKLESGETKWFASKDLVIHEDKTYEQGLEDAWELAKKIDSFDTEERTKILGYITSEYIKTHYTVQEALAKLKAYEDEHTIKVGDVVTFGMRTLVVTYADDEDVVGIERDGYLIKINNASINEIKKTGKRIDIAGMLEQIG